MPAVTKITTKYQVTLPREVRQALRAKVGDLLVFVPQTDGSIPDAARPATLDRCPPVGRPAVVSC